MRAGAGASEGENDGEGETAAALVGLGPLITVPGATEEHERLARACVATTLAERWDEALAACRDSYWSLIGRGTAGIETDDLAAARAPVHRSLGRIAEGTRHPEQAMYWYRAALQGGEDPEVRARLEALSLRPVNSTLSRPVFEDVMFHLGGSLATGTRLHEVASALDDGGIPHLAGSVRYERRAESPEHDLEVGLLFVDERESTQVLGRLRRGETWWSLGGLAGGSISAGPRTVSSIELVELTGGDLPEVRVVTSDQRSQMDVSSGCIFQQHDHRVLSVFGLREGVGAVRYVEVMIARSERQEAALHCRTPPERVPPTFHWAVEPTFDPVAGTLELRPTAGTFPDEVLGPIPLDAFHCRWGEPTSAWTCPSR